jgi:hypothetical protein
MDCQFDVLFWGIGDRFGDAHALEHGQGQTTPHQGHG